MGHRGRRAAGQEIVCLRGARAPRPSNLRRRTVPWFRCGVFFFSFIAAACGSAPAPPAGRAELIIGISEGSVASAEIGVRELINALTLEGLTQVDVDGRALPRLAERWVWEDDGLTLRIYLRPGLKFHDGTSLTAKVAAEIVRQAVARPANKTLYPWLNEIIDVIPDTDPQFLIKLAHRSALLPEDLQFPLSIRDGAEEIGTGAYRVARRDSGNVVLEAFDDYHLGAPTIRRLVLNPFDTIRAAWASLLRGDVDMVTDVPGEAIEFVQNDDVEVISFARRYQFLIAFNARRALLRSPTVRRALNVAIDRDALIQSVLQGHGVAATGPFWPKHWAYDQTVGGSGFDRTFATSLLDRAGFTPGSSSGAASEIPGARLRFECLLPADFSVLERVALDLQKQLYEIGVDMQFQVVPIEEYNVRIRAGQFDAVLIDLISGPTLSRPYVFWTSPARFQGINAFGYENAEADRLFELLRTSTNEAGIRSTLSRLQRVLLEDPPALFIAWNERARAIRRDFQIVREEDRDPLFTIWQWAENTDREPVSTQ